MEVDLIDLYRRAGEWTVEIVKGATSHLDAPTPCDQWDVRTLMNHMLDTQKYFTAVAQGKSAPPPAAIPPDLVGENPVATFEEAKVEIVEAFGQPGVVDKTGPTLGIAFADQLLHGWDLAKATGQPTDMPTGLPDAAYEMIHGRFTDEQRKGVFNPEVVVAPDATPQERLLAYTGRDPSWQRR